MGISSLTDITNGSPLRGIGSELDYGETTFNWSDGTPTASATGAFTGIQHFPGLAGEGFSFTVPADTVERELTLYVTVHHGIGRLTATLSDGSASPYTQDYNAININNSLGIYKIDYAANSTGQTLNVQLTIVTVGGSDPNVAIQGASLAIVPEPSSLMICSSGLFSFITVFAWRCRRNWPISGRKAA